MHLGHDLRVVGRGLLRAPALTLLVVLTLGLAIGANSATFSLIDRVALRPLPVEKPEQLVMLTAQPLPVEGPSFMMGGGKMMGMDYPLFHALREALSPMFTSMALRRPWRFTLFAAPAAIEIAGEYVDAGYFRVLGLRPLLGRTFTRSEDVQKGGPPFVETVNVSADYFATIGLPIVAGRAFDARDGTSAARVAIVNETLARLIAAQPAVVGETIGFDGGPPDVQIVGVARDARGQSLKVPSEPTVFRPLAQAGGYGAVSVLLRSETPRAISAMAAADLVRRIDPGVAIREFGRLDALARNALLRERMLAGLSLVFAGLSALLAGMGLFGVASFNVTNRTREIGIRLALGASRGTVERMVLREVAWLVAAGAALGVALFMAGNRVLGSMLFEVSPDDPLTIAVAAVGLAVMTTMAGLLPARRAARVDPAVTLRRE